MFKPDIGKCTKCGVTKEVWPEYKMQCNDCFETVPSSKYMIDGVPLVRIVEDLLMERPIIKRIMEVAMVEYGVHRIFRLENDGVIYMVTGPDTVSFTGPKPVHVGEGVRVADPELLPKLNSLIDEHLKMCDFCQGVIETDKELDNLQ
jgi:hypothetical protein